MAASLKCKIEDKYLSCYHLVLGKCAAEIRRCGTFLYVSLHWGEILAFRLLVAERGLDIYSNNTFKGDKNLELII